MILGNHDYKFRDNPISLNYFETVEKSKLIRDNNKWVQLCHYPILLWYRKNKGAYHVFSHIHDDSYTREFYIIKDEKHIFNGCVEINNFELCNLEKLIMNNGIFYKKH